MKNRRCTGYSRRHRYDRIERAATGLVCGTIIASAIGPGAQSAEFPVYPETETKFFLTVVDAEVEFFSDDKDR